MICFLSARRLKPGAFDDFRRAWGPERWPPEAIRAYHLRGPDDKNLVASFGLYEGSLAIQAALQPVVVARRRVRVDVDAVDAYGRRAEEPLLFGGPGRLHTPQDHRGAGLVGQPADHPQQALVARTALEEQQLNGRHAFSHSRWTGWTGAPAPHEHHGEHATIAVPARPPTSTAADPPTRPMSAGPSGQQAAASPPVAASGDGERQTRLLPG